MWFDALVQIFITSIIGFDQNQRAPLRRGGAFGTVFAYFGTVETQGRGSLHIHMMLWIAGLPPTNMQLRQRCMDSTQFIDTLKNFVSSTTCQSFSVGSENLACTTKGCDGKGLDLIDISSPPSSKYTIEEPTIKCKKCEKQLIATDVVKSTAESLALQSIVTMAQEKPSEFLNHVWDGVPQSLEDRAALTLLQLKCVNHHHTESCFKNKRKVCRFRYPRHVDPANQDSIDSDDHDEDGDVRILEGNCALQNSSEGAGMCCYFYS